MPSSIVALSCLHSPLTLFPSRVGEPFRLRFIYVFHQHTPVQGFPGRSRAQVRPERLRSEHQVLG